MRKFKNYLITFIVGLVLSVIVFFIRDAFVQTNIKTIIKNCSDAAFVPGVLIFCYGLLMLSVNGGTFDMLIYGTRQFFGFFKKNYNRKLAQSFYEYRKTRESEKREFAYFLIVGGFYIALSLLFLLIYYKV